jgi:hypothetical protein
MFYHDLGRLLDEPRRELNQALRLADEVDNPALKENVLLELRQLDLRDRR